MLEEWDFDQEDYKDNKDYKVTVPPSSPSAPPIWKSTPGTAV